MYHPARDRRAGQLSQQRRRAFDEYDQKVRLDARFFGDRLAVLRRSVGMVLRDGILRICEKSASGSVLQSAGLFLRQHRQIFDVQSGHASDDGRDQRTAGVYDADPYCDPRAIHADLRYEHGVRSRRMAGLRVRTARSVPRNRAFLHCA